MMQMKIKKNYIASLFIPETALSELFDCLNCILEKKLKNSNKIAFCIESKVQFLMELNVKTREDSAS